MGCPIPADRNWDRYDYSDGSSSWDAPFARGAVAGSNNGMTLQQILGYRTILLNTGTIRQRRDGRDRLRVVQNRG